MDKYHDYRKKSGKQWRQIPAQNIINWLQNNFEYKIRKGGSEYCICDPFSGDTKYKFNINPDNGICHSWHGDEWAGPINPKTGRRNCTVVNFVKIYQKCSYREALSILLGEGEDVSDYLKPEGRISESINKNISVALPDGCEVLSISEDKQAIALKRWLISRGYTISDMERAELYYLGMDVYWPYFEFEELVYWQSRSRMNKRFEFPPEEIYDKEGQLVGKTHGTKGDYFYGFDQLEMASYVIITEAIFDQNTLGEQCIASGGCDLTLNQISKLKIIGPKKGIILSPDNDDAGIGSIIRNKQILASLNIPLYYSLPPRLQYEHNGVVHKTKDWNEIGEKVSGFSEVRKLHDRCIKKVDLKEIIKLKNMLPKGVKR